MAVSSQELDRLQAREVECRLLDVTGHVDEHGAAATRPGDVKAAFSTCEGSSTCWTSHEFLTTEIVIP